MRQTARFFKVGAALVIASAVLAGAAEYVGSNASGSTNAEVPLVAKAGKTLRLVSLDATSDKAASVATWFRADGALATVALAAADDATNLLCYASGLASNDVVLLQNAAGTITERTVWGRVDTTNHWLLLRSALGTNQAVGDPVYEMATNNTTIATEADIATNATGLHVSSTNGFAADDVILITSVTNATSILRTVQEVTETNLTLTAELGGFAVYQGDRVRKLSPATLILAAAASSDRVLASSAGGFTVNEELLFAPATGGIFTNHFRQAVSEKMCTLSLTGESGVEMLPGANIYGGTLVTTPIGAATVRMFGGAVFVAPLSRPGLVRVDGTSAVKINNVVAVYE